MNEALLHNFAGNLNIDTKKQITLKGFLLLLNTSIINSDLLIEPKV